jgi:hypothetical protein
MSMGPRGAMLRSTAGIYEVDVNGSECAPSMTLIASTNMLMKPPFHDSWFLRTMLEHALQPRRSPLRNVPRPRMANHTPSTHYCTFAIHRSSTRPRSATKSSR